MFWLCLLVLKIWCRQDCVNIYFSCIYFFLHINIVHGTKMDWRSVFVMGTWASDINWLVGKGLVMLTLFEVIWWLPWGQGPLATEYYRYVEIFLNLNTYY